MPDPRLKQIRKRLREARQQEGLSPVEVAEKMGMQQPLISKIESGKTSFDVIRLLDFAELYGKDVDCFLRDLEA